MEEAHLEEVHQEEVHQEEVHQEAVFQEEALPEEAHQEEEAPQEEDPQEEDNHLHSKLKRHNQYPNKLDHATNPFEEQRLRNSEETEPTPRNL